MYILSPVSVGLEYMCLGLTACDYPTFQGIYCWRDQILLPSRLYLFILGGTK